MTQLGRKKRTHLFLETDVPGVIYHVYMFNQIVTILEAAHDSIEIITNLGSVLFSTYLFGALAVSFSLSVINVMNPVMAIFCLLAVFIIAVIIFMLFGCEYFAIIFAIVYIGAITTLLLFVVMMLNIKLIVNTVSSFNFLFIFVNLTAIICFAAWLYIMAMGRNMPWNDSLLYSLELLSRDDLVLNIHSWWIQEREHQSIALIAQLLYSKNVYSLFISGVVLLIGMIGSLVLAYYSNKRVKRYT